MTARCIIVGYFPTNQYEKEPACLLALSHVILTSQSRCLYFNAKKRQERGKLGVSKKL